MRRRTGALLTLIFACILVWGGLTVLDERHAAAAPLPVTLDGAWHWTDVPATKCLDDSTTGLAINAINANAKVLVYMDGGGFCFDAASCQQIPPPGQSGSGSVRYTHFGLTEFNDNILGTGTNCPGPFCPATFNFNHVAGQVGTAWPQVVGARGIFDRTNAANPFKNYTFVFVPYCTGDLHQGAQQDNFTVVPLLRTPSHAWHWGYVNFGIFANLIQQTFPAAPFLALVGESAGGFGAYYNFGQLRSLYSIFVRMALISDGGVPFWTGDQNFFPRQGFIMRNVQPGPGIPNYEEDYMAEAWGLDLTHPPLVPAVTRIQAYRPIYPQQNVFLWFANTNLGDTFGVLSGNDDLTVPIGFHLNFPPNHPNLADGLLDFQTFAANGKINVRTLYVTNTSQPDSTVLPWNEHHTYLSDDVNSLVNYGIIHWLNTQFSL